MHAYHCKLGFYFHSEVQSVFTKLNILPKFLATENYCQVS